MTHSQKYNLKIHKKIYAQIVSKKDYLQIFNKNKSVNLEITQLVLQSNFNQS